MDHEEQLKFLLMILSRGSQVIEPQIVGETIEFEVDRVCYIVKIRKAS